MKVVLAEKPSVARELAAFLKATSRRDGYFEGRGYQVTWALGHLVDLKEPADYDRLKTWSLETLPFVPKKFELKLRGDKGAREQFAVVKRLFGGGGLICATDAGREGELIFRYILTLDRLHAETSPTALAQFAHTSGNSICVSFAAAVGGLRQSVCRRQMSKRSRLDRRAERDEELYVALWHCRDSLESGRVQTPVLAMIVRRDDEIRTFKPQPFWELMTNYRKMCFRYAGDRFDKQEEAQALLKRVSKQSGHPEGGKKTGEVAPTAVVRPDGIAARYESSLWNIGGRHTAKRPITL